MEQKTIPKQLDKKLVKSLTKQINAGNKKLLFDLADIYFKYGYLSESNGILIKAIIYDFDEAIYRIAYDNVIRVDSYAEIYDILMKKISINDNTSDIPRSGEIAMTYATVYLLSGSDEAKRKIMRNYFNRKRILKKQNEIVNDLLLATQNT